MRVTALVPPFVPIPGFRTVVSSREFFHVDTFAKELGEALGVDVPIVEGSLADVPASGFLLVFRLSGDVDPLLGPRIVAVAEDRSTIIETVETYNLAAAVEQHRYHLWRARIGAAPSDSRERGDSLVGRKDVGALMGARVERGPYPPSERYGMLESTAASDLPALLAAYLRVYVQVVNLE